MQYFSRFLSETKQIAYMHRIALKNASSVLTIMYLYIAVSIAADIVGLIAVPATIDIFRKLSIYKNNFYMEQLSGDFIFY